MRINEKVAVQSLRTLKEVFDLFGIKLWLDAGTLLGAVREGKLIEWDYDIDLGMWNYDGKKLFFALKELRNRSKVKVRFPLYPNIQSFTLKFLPNDFCIDISLWEIKGNNAISIFDRPKLQKHFSVTQFFHALRIVRHYLCSDVGLSVSGSAGFLADILEKFLPSFPTKSKVLLLKLLQHSDLGYVKWISVAPKRYYEKLETMTFYGMTFHTPSNVEEYLEYHYGLNWRTPQKKWDWVKDDQAQNWFAIDGTGADQLSW